SDRRRSCDGPRMRIALLVVAVASVASADPLDSPAWCPRTTVSRGVPSLELEVDLGSGVVRPLRRGGFSSSTVGANRDAGPRLGMASLQLRISAGRLELAEHDWSCQFTSAGCMRAATKLIPGKSVLADPVPFGSCVDYLSELPGGFIAAIVHGRL